MPRRYASICAAQHLPSGVLNNSIFVPAVGDTVGDSVGAAVGTAVGDEVGTTELKLGELEKERKLKT